MIIRKAGEKDINDILKLLSQVLEIHAEIRPDVFISGTTKYTDKELKSIINGKKTPVFVATDDKGNILGYAFCILKEQPVSNNLKPFKYLYIDDLCVDENARGKNIGKALFKYVCNYAKKNGLYEITLNVWEGNESAKMFYEKMGLTPKKTEMEYIL